MTLAGFRMPHHGRYAYSPIGHRADYSWPGGHKLAVYIAINIEHFAFGAGEGPSPTPEVSGSSEGIQRAYAWRDYGMRIGIWRIFDLLDEFGMPACHLVNAAVCDEYPELITALRGRPDDIVGHGRTNAERQGLMWEGDESRLIAESTDILAETFGVRPSGWMSPGRSESRVTLDLLKEAGYEYVLDWPIDDQPLWMTTRSGPILSVPYPIELNDLPAQVKRGITAAAFTEMFVDQFDEMLVQSKQQPLVLGISLHPYVTGQPYRLRAFRRILQHISKARDDIWMTRPDEIARHVQSLDGAPGSL